MILRRYMTRQVATTTALVVMFLVVLLLGGRMIRYFGIAAEGRLDVGLLFTIIGYNVPYFLELILPLSFFIGLMLVFGRLYVDSEMAVLNGSGVSRGRLARLMTPLILALFVMEAGLSLFAKPWGVRQSDTIWQQQSLNSAFDLIQPQSFISSDDYHLYVGSMSDDRSELRDIILIQTIENPDQHNNPTHRESDIDISTINNQPNPDLAMTGNIMNDVLDSTALSNESTNLGDEATVNNDTVNNETVAADDTQTESNNNDLLATITSPVVSNKPVVPNEQIVSNKIAPDSSTATDTESNSASTSTSAKSVNLDKANDTGQNQIAPLTRDVVVLAKTARQVQGGEDSHKTQLDLYQGRRYEIDANSRAYNQVSFERYRISIDRPPTDTVTEDNVETQTLPALWQAATGQQLPIPLPTALSTPATNSMANEVLDQALNQQEHYQQQVLPARAELGYRFALPWLMIIAPMLAVPLAQVRPRQGRWLRLLPAIVIYTSCALVIISLKNPVAKGTLTVWIYPIAILAFIALGLYLNWASRIHHRVRFGLTAKNEGLS